MKYKYGDFSDMQISEIKKIIRKHIFFLLLIVDPDTKDKYKNVNVSEAFENELKIIGGLNSILFNPPELVQIISLLEAARIEWESSNYEFAKYRKLILDAGNEVLKIREDGDK